MDKTTKLLFALEEWIDSKISDALALQNNNGYDSCLGLGSWSKSSKVEKLLREALKGEDDE